jgi:hypothetical protein
MTDLHQQIADLEAEIDTLSDAAEQCRKSMVVAKVAIGGGILLFVACLLGLIRSDAILLRGRDCCRARWNSFLRFEPEQP